jgi:TetR/AcrR family transcriptional repressor of nem operon
MRYSEEHKAETRARILKAAASRFREDGIEGASLPEVMQDAGLTVGGFYRHFESKDDLFRAAMDQSLEDTLAIFAGGDPSVMGEDWARAVARVYLSMAHRANTRDGCPIPALAADVSRADEAIREQSESNLKRLAEGVAERLGEDAPREAWTLLATLVGGLTLSRMVEDPDTAQTILRAAREGAARCGKTAAESAES